MNQEAKIKKVLVVLSPDLVRPDKPMESALLRRAVSVAKITGCEIELFHACYDSKLDHGFLVSDDDLRRERERLIDGDATRLAELATRLRAEGVDVRYEVRWDHPRIDAILRKTAQACPDLVLKQAREHSYVLGLTSNTDWELARRSPVHVWLVSNEVDDIDRIVAAVGNSFEDSDDVTTTADYDLLRTAGLIGDTFKADVFPANAYQVPAASAYIADMAGTMVAPLTVQQEESREKKIRQHADRVKALAKYFDIAVDNIHVQEGYPNTVIPEVADAVNADMLVMGASNIGRLERLVSAVTIEPVMAETNCDILIIRDRDLSSVPDVLASREQGVAKYDLQHAITHPENTFDSPEEVAAQDDLSIEIRNRILQAWEYDIRAEMTEENEGGPVRDIDVNALDEIRSARASLESRRDRSADEPMRLNGTSG